MGRTLTKILEEPVIASMKYPVQLDCVDRQQVRDTVKPKNLTTRRTK